MKFHTLTTTMSRRHAPGSASRRLDYSVLTDASRSFFVEALSDPLNPKACSASLEGAIGGCGYERSSGEINRSLVEFYETAVAFLVSPKSSQEADSMLDQLDRCNCRIISRSFSAFFHQVGDQIIRDNTASITKSRPSTNFVVSIFSFLGLALNRVDTYALQSPSGARSQRKWPTSLQSLLPAPPRQIVACMAYWQRDKDIGIQAVVPQFLGDVVRLGRSDIVIEARNSDEFKAGILCSMQNIVDYFRERRGHRVHSQFYPVNPFYRTIGLILKISVLSGPGVLGGLAEWFKDDDAYVLASLLLEWNHLYPPPNDTEGELYAAYVTIKRQFGRTAKDVLDVLQLPRMLPPELESEKSLLFAELDSAKESIQNFEHVDLIASHLRQVHRMRECCNTRCPKRGSGASSKGGSSSCSGCQIMWYCSKECQRVDWKDENRPHKLVCKHIQSLKTAFRYGDFFELSDDFDKDSVYPALTYLWNAFMRKPQGTDSEPSLAVVPKA